MPLGQLVLHEYTRVRICGYMHTYIYIYMLYVYIYIYMYIGQQPTAFVAARQDALVNIRFEVVRWLGVHVLVTFRHGNTVGMSFFSQRTARSRNKCQDGRSLEYQVRIVVCTTVLYAH